MSVLKFAAYCGALVVFPAVLAGSVTFWLIDQAARRIEGRTLPGVVDEFESWNGALSAPRSIP